METPPTLRLCQNTSAWKGEDLRQCGTWILQLDGADNAELRQAVVHARKCGLGIPELTAADFPLPTLAPRIAHMLDELTHGMGLKLVRGFDIQNVSVPDAALAFWGLGAHMGVGRAQNAQGDLLGHVTDLGLDFKTNHNVRGYQTRLVLPFHNDALDIVGLMCVRNAKTGGKTRVVSSTAIHNAIARQRPDLLRVAFEDFYQDKRGEAPEGTLPYHAGPLFIWLNNQLFCRYNRTFYESAQRFAEVPRLTAAQLELMQLIDALCMDPVYCLEMNLEPGDMQFLNNYTVLHSRTAYQDWDDFDKRRYLLRLWLDTGKFGELPEAIANRHQDMLRWQANPKPPSFDLSMVRAELAH